MKKIYEVNLSKEDRVFLETIIHSGKNLASVYKRAHILLKAHAGLAGRVIAEHVSCGTTTVSQVRKCYVQNGLESTLYEKKRSGRPPSFSDKEISTVVATACTDPPEGYGRWSINLLLKVIRKKEGIPIGRTKIATVLRDHDLKPWLKKNVVHS